MNHRQQRGSAARRSLVAGAALCALAAAEIAAAQAYRWVDEKGRVQYSDQPPPGAPKSQRVVKPPPPGPATATQDGKAGSARPLSAAEQEQAFRKRRAEADKAQLEADAKQADAKTRDERCVRAKHELAHLESGVRIQKMDAKGELYYMEDAEREKGIARLRAEISSCR